MFNKKSVRVLLCLFLVSATQSAFAATVQDTVAKPGAYKVKMLSYTLQKNCVNVADVKGITLVYDGDSAQNIRAVYGAVNGKILTRKKSIDPKTLTVSLSFSRTSGLKTCGGTTIDMYADIARTAKIGTKNRLSIELASDVLTDKEDVGVPTQGPWIQIAR